MVDLAKMPYGTGFFLKYNSTEYLFTNYHVIPKKSKILKLKYGIKK